MVIRLGLAILTVKTADECLELVRRGLRARRQAATRMNTESSRSHAIFSVTVEVSENVLGKDRITVGKLNFVDLAGSERHAKTGLTTLTNVGICFAQT